MSARTSYCVVYTRAGEPGTKQGRMTSDDHVGLGTGTGEVIERINVLRVAVEGQKSPAGWFSTPISAGVFIRRTVESERPN